MSGWHGGDDPYTGCAVYRQHGACACSTGLPMNCTADQEPNGDRQHLGQIDGCDLVRYEGLHCIVCGDETGAHDMCVACAVRGQRLENTQAWLDGEPVDDLDD